MVLAVRTALQVDYPSDQEEQEAHAEQHGGLLVDVRQWVRMDLDPSMSACHAPEQKKSIVVVSNASELSSDCLRLHVPCCVSLPCARGAGRLSVLLAHPRCSAVRLSHALQVVIHHLAGWARSLRRSVGRQWPRGERGARQRVALRGEISAGGAAREVEYRPGLKHA